MASLVEGQVCIGIITLGAGGAGHDLLSVPGENFARAHFHLIAELRTSPRAEGEL